jgi:hypothetical protein
VNDLQALVARAADRAGSHGTAPALLLQASAALGKLADLANTSTEGGRRPFRIPPEWESELAALGHLVYLLADQTAVDLEAGVRSLAGQVRAATGEPHRQPATEDHWFSGTD